MNCPHCGNENAEDSIYCIKCGQVIPPGESVVSKRREKSTSNIAQYIIPIIDIIAACLFIIAGSKIFGAGSSMEVLRSVAGDSVAESFYQDMGRALQGFAFIAWALAMYCIQPAIKRIWSR